MTRSNLVCLFLMFLLALTASASVPALIELDSQILDTPRAGQILMIKVKSALLPIEHGVVQVTIGGDYLDAANVTRQISLKIGETAVLRLPVETKAEGELSNVMVRVLRDNDTTPLVVRELYVTGVAERARLIRPDEARQMMTARNTREAEARAKVMAEEHVRSVLASGGKPLMNHVEPAQMSITERAWNDAVQRLAPSNEKKQQRVRSECGSYQLSPRNHDWGMLSGYL